MMSHYKSCTENYTVNDKMPVLTNVQSKCNKIFS